MTNQQRLEEIEQRLNILNELNKKIDKIIILIEHGLSPKENVEPLTTFIKANNVENTFVEDRTKELFAELDEVKNK